MRAFQNGEINTPEIQKYLQSTELTDGQLWQSTIQQTIQKGAAPAICMREAIPIFKMDSPVETRTIEPAGSYLDVVAEGAEIPMATDTFTTATFTAVKYGRRPFISNELILGSKFATIEDNLRRSGRWAENTLNRVALLEIIGAGVTAEYDTAETATNQGTVALNTGIETVQSAGFIPDTAVVHPAMLKQLRSEFADINVPMGEAVRSTGYIGNYMGLKLYVTTVSTGDGTYVWGSSNGEFMGCVYDSDCVRTGMFQDIRHNKWADNDRDMIGLSVLMNLDCEVLNAAGLCKIEA